MHSTFGMTSIQAPAELIGLLSYLIHVRVMVGRDWDADQLGIRLQAVIPTQPHLCQITRSEVCKSASYDSLDSPTLKPSISNLTQLAYQPIPFDMSQTPQTPGQQHLISKLQGDLPYSAPPSPISSARTIGVIGLGNIGGNIAKNLAIHLSKSQHHSKHSIVLWNRSEAKAHAIVAEVEARLEKDGGIASVSIAKSVEELVKQSDIVLTSLSNDHAVLEVYEIIIKALQVRTPSLLQFFKTCSSCFPCHSGRTPEHRRSRATEDHRRHEHDLSHSHWPARYEGVRHTPHDVRGGTCLRCNGRGRQRAAHHLPRRRLPFEEGDRVPARPCGWKEGDRPGRKRREGRRF